MKLIIAVFRSVRLDAVLAALDEHGASPLDVSQVVGNSREQGQRLVYRGREVQTPWPKVRAEVAVDDWCADEVAAAIAQAGSCTHSGQVDRAKVIVLSLDHCVPTDREAHTAVARK